jgi:hypothetical protein
LAFGCALLVLNAPAGLCFYFCGQRLARASASRCLRRSISACENRLGMPFASFPSADAALFMVKVSHIRLSDSTKESDFISAKSGHLASNMRLCDYRVDCGDLLNAKKKQIVAH